MQATLEAGTSVEGRSEDTDGNPETARAPLDPVSAWGVSGEVGWMVTGQHRRPGDWPVADRLGVEVAARGSRLVLGEGAADVTGSAATEVGGGVRLWHPIGLAAVVHGGAYLYDVAPLEELDVHTSWFLAARVTARWRDRPD